MRIRIKGKRGVVIDEQTVAGGLLVGSVAAQVGSTAVELYRRATGQEPNPFANPNFGKSQANPYDQFDAPNPYDQFDTAPGDKPPPKSSKVRSTNTFSDPNFGAAPATAAPARTRPPASQPNPFADPEFGK
ncbi:MAG TPA: hypothetical protein VGR65_03935 [Casimicrobiaceae bacterium]|nr:hypothetical protein [Casimicrobiaceae bacterium]